MKYGAYSVSTDKELIVYPGDKGYIVCQRIKVIWHIREEGKKGHLMCHEISDL